MAIYTPPNYTQPLSIFNPANYGDDETDISVSYLNSHYLKYPVAQGQETISNLVCTNITAPADLTLNPTGSIDCNGKTLNMTGGEIHNCDLIHSQNNTDIVIEGKGTGDVILKTNNTNRMTFTDTGDINTANRIVMNSATSANRTINTSLLGLNENSGGYSSTLLGQIYQSGTTQFQQNLVNSGAINFVVKDSGGNNITPFQATSTADNIPSNVNLNMAAGTGIINQTGIVGSNTAINTFKRSQVVINSNSAGGSATAGLEVYDDGAGAGRGLFILPNSGSGSLGNTNQTNDCCLTSRATQNSNTLTLSNWNSNFRNGMRIFTTDISNCGLTLQCGQSSTNDWTELAMNYNRGTNTTTTTFNNVINFNPSGNLAPSRRQLTGLGTLNFTDISGNTTTGARNSLIYMDSSANVAGMFYDCSLNNGSHNFVVNDNSGNKKTPVFFGSALTSVLNTFSVRNESITSNRLDISTDASQATTIRARSSTNSTIASINVNCDSVSAGGAVSNLSVLSIAPTYVQSARPFRLIYQTFPTAATELGYTFPPTKFTNLEWNTSTSIRNMGSFTISSTGTYLINIMTWINPVSVSATVSEYTIAIDGTSATFPSFTTPTAYTPSLFSEFNVGTLTTSNYCYEKTILNITITSSTTFYVNFVLTFTGGGNINQGCVYSYTRIG